MVLERKTTASSDQPNMYGTTALANRYHGILPDLVHRSHGHGGNAQDILEQLDGHFDNLAPAATNSHALLDQTFAATTEQYAEIKAALDNLSSAEPASLLPDPHQGTPILSPPHKST